MRGGRAADMSLPRLNTSFAEGTPLPGPGPLRVWVCVRVHGLFVCKGPEQMCVCACV